METMYLSLGERPVKGLVLTTSAPLSENWASPALIAASATAAGGS